MPALAGLLKDQRGDHWSGFSVSTVAGLLGGLCYCSLGVSAVAGLLGEGTLYPGLECLP